MQIRPKILPLSIRFAHQRLSAAIDALMAEFVENKVVIRSVLAPSSSPEFSPSPTQKSRLSIQSHALQPLHSPSSLLEHDELPLKATKGQRRPVHSLSERLDCLSSILLKLPASSSPSGWYVTRSRFPHRSGEIGNQALPTTSVARSRMEVRARPLTPACQADRIHNRNGKKDEVRRAGIKKRSGGLCRQDGLYGPNLRERLLSEEVTRPSPIGLAIRNSAGRYLSDWSSSSREPWLVDKPRQLEPLVPDQKAQAHHEYVDSSEIGWGGHTEEGDWTS